MQEKASEATEWSAKGELLLSDDYSEPVGRNWRIGGLLAEINCFKDFSINFGSNLGQLELT